jgi:hypothetical protein
LITSYGGTPYGEERAASRCRRRENAAFNVILNMLRSGQAFTYWHLVLKWLQLSVSFVSHLLVLSFVFISVDQRRPLLPRQISRRAPKALEPIESAAGYKT